MCLTMCVLLAIHFLVFCNTIFMLKKHRAIIFIKVSRGKILIIEHCDVMQWRRFYLVGKLLLDDGVGGCQKNLDILYDVVFRKISLESHPFITPIMAQNKKKVFYVIFVLIIVKKGNKTLIHYYCTMTN